MPLQYKIECYLSGVVDGPNASITISDRLDRLKRWQAARESLTWTKAQMDFEGYEGTWFTCKAFGPVFCEKMGKELAVVRPASALRGVTAKEWSFNLPYEPVGYACDYSQHLLVIVEQTEPKRENAWTIHLWSFLTGSEHPDCSAMEDLTAEFRPPRAPGHENEESDSDEPYEVNPNDDEVEFFLDVQVVGSLLALTCQVYVMEMGSYCTETWVWNWKTGKLLLDFPKIIKDGMSHKSYFPLLDDKHILVPVEHPGIGRGTFGVNGVAVVPVYPAKSRRQTYEAAVKTATVVLALPGLQSRISGGDVRLAFAPVAPPHQSWDPQPIFAPDPRLALLRIVLSTDHYSSGGGPARMLFAVPVHVLLDALAAPRAGTKTTIVPWARWAPHAHVAKLRAVWYDCAVAATWCVREAREVKHGGHERTIFFTLSDFATRRSLRRSQAAAKGAETDEPGAEVVLDPEPLEQQDRFVQKPMPVLPHRRHQDAFKLRYFADRIALGDYYVVVHRSKGQLGGTMPAPDYREVFSI
ncbi:hypothetical protein PsYK624_164520 [Phanerochaete sordida]|uniref:Uncharacterized protein n=1 Tax=Phanerochaete sordida TaxID=48140 RepID=A0A9P3GQW2_9APHY|nr:hypothetical protein PsYK624_164520 [Phanerochaete sordida]